MNRMNRMNRMSRMNRMNRMNRVGPARRTVKRSLRTSAASCPRPGRAAKATRSL
jgi:hypothetical protein